MNITQSATNDLIFYVKSGLATPFYLVQLVSNITADTFEFIVTDLADCDFVVAQMTEPGYLGTNDAINGTLKLDTGYFDLYLYDQSSSTNLDVTLTNSLLTSMECYVLTDDDTNRIFK